MAVLFVDSARLTIAERRAMKLNHNKSTTEENSEQPDQLNLAVPELLRERLKMASRFALTWVNALNLASEQETVDPALIILAEKIISWVGDENPDNGILEKGINELGFSRRARNYLIEVGIITVGDFLPFSYRELKRRHVGPRSIEEIRIKLGALGIALPEE